MSLPATRYKLNGRDPADGLDCFQLVRWWWREHRGVDVPDLAYDETSYPAVFDAMLANPTAIGWEPRSGALLACDGDLVVLDVDGRPHCGVYDGGRVLTMTKDGEWNPRWTRVCAYVTGVFRYAAPSSSAASSAADSTSSSKTFR